MLPDESRRNSVLACCSHYQLHPHCEILLQSVILKTMSNVDDVSNVYKTCMNKCAMHRQDLLYWPNSHLMVRRIRTMRWHYRATPCISVHLKHQNIGLHTLYQSFKNQVHKHLYVMILILFLISSKD